MNPTENTGKISKTSAGFCQIFCGQGSQIGGNRGNDPIERMDDTVDGKNPANQLRLAAYPLFTTCFIHPRWLFGISSINSIWRVGGLSTLPETIVTNRPPKRTVVGSDDPFPF